MLIRKLGAVGLVVSILAAASGSMAQQSDVEAPACDGFFSRLSQACSGGGSTVRMPIGANTEELTTPPGSDFDQTGFSISIDGQPHAGAPIAEDGQRQADLRAGLVDIDIRFDGLNSARTLAVETRTLRQAFAAGETITFQTSSNYPAFIDRAEILVFRADQPDRDVIARLPVAPNASVSWVMPSDGGDQMRFVLRAYAASGRYDETYEKDLVRSPTRAEATQKTGPVIAAGYGDTNLAVTGIPITGGRITVSGRNVGPFQSATVMGEVVPVDGTGRFAVSRILPVGRHVISVSNGQGAPVVREVLIPGSDWFRVGIIDITAGYRLRDDLLSGDPDFEPFYLNGRAGVFIDGRTASGWAITASADSGDGPIEDIFQRLDAKDPRRVLDRLNILSPSRIYGDDSEIYDQAPSSGRVFLRAEKDGSFVQWGDFDTNINNGYFLGDNRALYGAQVQYVSPRNTRDGQPRIGATAFAAQPDTLPQRDVFRGTGGSIYILQRQDVNAGSEAVYVEVLDPDTGRVVSTTQLVAQADYTIDYFQGILTLSNPLASSVAGGVGLAQSYDQNLVVIYEYTPPIGSVDGASVGGRLEARLSDNVVVGVTGSRENTDTADQTAGSVDVQVNFGANGFVRAEAAQTDGPGFGRFVSTDGGLSSTEITAAGGTGSAVRVEAQADLSDLGLPGDGRVSFFFEDISAGFSTLHSEYADDQLNVGLSGTLQVSEATSLTFSGETFETSAGIEEREISAGIGHMLSDRLTLGLTVANLDKTTPGDPAETGQRTDARLSFDFSASEDRRYFGYFQQTMSKSGGLADNDRFGLGTEMRLTEKLTFGGEISDGTAGPGAQVMFTHRANEAQEVYFGYALDPTRTLAGYDLVGTDSGSFVLGGRVANSDAVVTYGENRVDLFGERRTVTSAYGVNYTPDDVWTFSGDAEAGVVRDSINGDFDMRAVSLAAAKTLENKSTRARLEYRWDDGVGVTQDRETFAFSAGHSRQTSEDWRLIFNVDGLFSESAESALRDGQYFEGQLAYAFRPTDGSPLNMIASFTHLLDQPGEDQVTVSGSTDGPKQRSNILEVDANYAVSEKLTLGGKIGLRHSEIAPRGTDTYTATSAHLAILRADWHVVHEWDIGGEIRVLEDTGADATQYGGVIGIYRHFGNSAKVGIGYEWGTVSDDLADIDYESEQVFLNIIAKM